MTTRFLSRLTALLLCSCMFTSCVKEILKKIDPGPCEDVAELHTSAFTPVEKGQAINIAIPPLDDVNYLWRGPGNFESYSPNTTVTDYADYSHRGWYYVTISHNECDTRYDSVYVDVKFPQGTSECTLTNNTADFSGAVLLGDQSYSYVSFGPGLSGYEITGNSSNGDMRITASPYWRTHDFEDGIYYTTNDPLPDEADIDRIYITNVNQNIFWTAEADKAVYISHVGGKPRISFCNISFSGSFGGRLYTTLVSAQLTEP